MHEKVWKEFSRFIRLRDAALWVEAHPEYNGDPQAPCVTCKRLYPVASLQAGHFISRRYKSLLYEETNVHAQCYGCNVGRSGSIDEYFLYMENRYGRPHVDALIARKAELKTFTVEELTEMLAEYQGKVGYLTET